MRRISLSRTTKLDVQLNCRRQQELAFSVLLICHCSVSLSAGRLLICGLGKTPQVHPLKNQFQAKVGEGAVKILYR